MQPEPLTFFIDRCVGSGIVASALRKAGREVEVHDDHFPQNTPDEDWIPVAAKRGWIVVTRDKRIRRHHLEDLVECEARVFIIINQATGPEMASLLVSALPAIERFAARRQPPFIAGITQRGTISSYSLTGGSRSVPIS